MNLCEIAIEIHVKINYFGVHRTYRKPVRDFVWLYSNFGQNSQDLKRKTTEKLLEDRAFHIFTNQSMFDAPFRKPPEIFAQTLYRQKLESLGYIYTQTVRTYLPS